MVLSRVWDYRFRVRQGLLIIVMLLAMPTRAQGDDSAAAIGKALDATSLMAQAIEARMMSLQRDTAADEARSGAHHLTQAMVAFYAQRQYRPIWDRPGRLQQLVTELAALADDGLNPQDYQIDQLRHAFPLLGDDSADAVPLRLADEMRATNAYLRALYHLYNGKVNPAVLDSQWNFEWQEMAPIADAARLAEVVEAGQIAALFEQTRPQHMIYRSFKAGLRHYRRLAAQGGWPALPAGPTLKPCAVDPQIAILRQRLGVTGEYPSANVPGPMAAEETQARAHACLAVPAAKETVGQSVSSAAVVDPDEVFDERLVMAVKKFQREQYLEVDGALGPATRAALNVSVQSRIDQIRVNLDRARWLLHNIPPEMLLVDIAGFKITYFKASQPIWRSRVQVGMSYRTSPIFRSEVNYITLNPTWTIPPTILRNDVLPKLRKDLNYLRDNKIRVLDSSGKPLDPASIDWYRPGNVTLRQDAGPHSALGKAVIRFPNTYAVYLHDTPHQKLFNKSQRAFSSGCIRVERALELVELLLAETPGWDKATIDAALQTGKTRNVTLAKRVPILLAYWTVDAVSETEIAFKPDIYARDAKVLAALNKRD